MKKIPLLAWMASLCARPSRRIRTLAASAVAALSFFSAEAAEYSWQEAQATVIETGDLEWNPKPFVYEEGSVVRYIDYETGDDANAGASINDPWKHHPWDERATGNADAHSGITTYVFKRGVAYRVWSDKDAGQERAFLSTEESGAPGDPIRLTSDPNWTTDPGGDEEAVLTGSRVLQDTWQVATETDIPQYMDISGQTVYFMDLDEPDHPRFTGGGTVNEIILFLVEPDGTPKHIELASSTGWNSTNPNFMYEHWWSMDGLVDVDPDPENEELWKQDADNLTGFPDDYFDGGTLWVQVDWVIGTPAPKDPLEAGEYNSALGALDFGHYRGVAEGTRYLIEDLPQFLDSPNEYYYAHDYNGEDQGRLYLRLPDDRDPNNEQIELAISGNLLEFRHSDHIEVSGLTFSRTHRDGDVLAASGNIEDFVVENCQFIQVGNDAIGIAQENLDPDGYVMNNVVVRDCDFEDVHGGTAIFIKGDGDGEMDPDIVNTELEHVEVLRNRTYRNGMYRHNDTRFSNVPAINIKFPDTALIAGNFVDTSHGSGLVVFGGKEGSLDQTGWDIPLTRIVMYHNKTVNCALGSNDYGGLAQWQGGPIYSYNSISGNSVGHWPTGFGDSPDTTINLSYEIYIDGGFKIYNFNTIAWARGNDPSDPYNGTNPSFFNVFGFMNPFFNNTVNGQGVGLGGTSGNRNENVGNVFVDISKHFIESNHGGNPSLIGGGDDASSGIDGTGTLAFTRNLFHGDADAGTLVTEDRGAEKDISASTIPEMAQQMQDYPIRLGLLGTDVGDEVPIAKPLTPGVLSPKTSDADFRPAGGSPGIDSGVEYFVPWSLYGMVGEWHFQADQRSPGEVLDYHFYMSPAYFERSMYDDIPIHTLNIINDDASDVTVSDYTDGELENWVDGALLFDGSRHAVATHSAMTSDIAIKVNDWQNKDRNPPVAPWIVDPPTHFDKNDNRVDGEISADGSTAIFNGTGDNFERLELANPVTITADTILEFTFNSPTGAKGKTHAIGLDDDQAWYSVPSRGGNLVPDRKRPVIIYGSNYDKATDPADPKEIFHGQINIGPEYTGAGSDQTFSINLSQFDGYRIGDVLTHLIFINELDDGTGISNFKDIKIYESGQTVDALDLSAQVGDLRYWLYDDDDTGVFADTAEMRYPGDLRKSPIIDKENLIIEAYLRVDSGNTGSIAGLHDGSSGYRLYLNGSGQAVFEVGSSGTAASVTSVVAINDGSWYHLIGELDRDSSGSILNIYVDGVLDNTATSTAITHDDSLYSAADFIVGADNNLGNKLVGAMDFLRVSRGSFADAKTSIGELYAWQFDGPAQHDFMGNDPVGVRDAGAIEGSDPYSVSQLNVVPDLATADYLLSWQDNSASEDVYLVQRDTSPDFDSANLTEWTLMGADIESFTDDTAVSGTIYYYRVFAKNSSDTSPPSSVVKVEIGTQTPDLPINIGFEVDVDAGEIQVEWDILDDSNLPKFPTSWTVKWTTTPGSGYSSASGLTDHQHTITGIDPTQTYHVIVEAVNGGGTVSTEEYSVIAHEEDFSGVALGTFPSGWTITDDNGGDTNNGPVVATPPAEIVSPTGTPLVNGGSAASKVNIMWDAFDNLQYNMIEVVMMVESDYGGMELRQVMYDDGGTGEHVGRWSPNNGYLRTPNSGDVDFTVDAGETDSTTAIDGGEAWTYRYMTGPASNGDAAYMDIYVQLLDETGASRIDSNDVDEMVEDWGILRNAPKPSGVTRGSIGILMQRDEYWIDSIKILPFVYPGVTFDAPAPAPVTTRYEAEDAETLSGVTEETNSSVSNGKFIDYGGSGSFIEFDNIDGGTGGTASVTFGYAMGRGSSRYLDVIVNGDTANPISVEFSLTDTWTPIYTVTVDVPLTAGSNTVQLLANPTQGPNVDYIEVTVNGGGGTTVTAADDSASVDEGSDVTVSVLDNDTGATQIDSFTQGSSGTVTQSGADLVYAPNSGVWSGTDSFSYTAGDGSTSDTADVSMTINTTNGSDPLTDNADFDTELAFSNADGASRERSDGSFEVAAWGGAGIATDTTGDDFLFVKGDVSGDFTVRVQVKSIDGPSGSFAGVMIRDGGDTDGTNDTLEKMALQASESGTLYLSQERTSAGTGAAVAVTSQIDGTDVSHTEPEKWVMIERVGDTISYFTGEDDGAGNIVYTEIDASTATLTGLSDTVQVGLFTISGDGSSNATAVFDNYAVTELINDQTTFNNGGQPWAVPASGSLTVQFEDYDVGTATDAAYWDEDAENRSGGAYRDGDGVDIGDLGSGNYNIGYTRTDEWLEYTIDVASAGTYNLTILYASKRTPGDLKVILGGTPLADDGTILTTIDEPTTGSWGTYLDSSSYSITLPSGENVLRFEHLGGAVNLDSFTISN